MTAAAAVMPDRADAMILRILHAYQTRLQGLPHTLDTQAWLECAHGLPAAAATWRGASDVLGLRSVAMQTLMERAHRLAVLEVGDLRRVLAGRALYPRRTALARCIDGGYLSRLNGAVGPALVSAMAARADWQPDAGGPLPVPELRALAQTGLVALVSDGWLTDPSLIRLMRMTIGVAPAGRVGPPALTPLSESFMAAVPSIYPELSWLFG
ncbi:type III secretion protein HrpB4 [Ralstonia solanacearum]|uniref:type III secretion protein HrpB4 n=1 Tax=Ralstonia solanacearum TaxID=305 RepID=UPI0035193086